MHLSDVLQVLSVNVGLPRAEAWKGRTVVTGIFKERVAGRVAIRRLKMQGDRQAASSWQAASRQREKKPTENTKTNRRRSYQCKQ